MDTDRFRFDGERKFTGRNVKTDETPGLKNKAEGQKKLAENTQKIADLQEKLYAEGSQALLVVFQAMDAAGKDGTIRHVFSGVNPEAVVVSSFKQPSAAELARDYLWRIHGKVPPRGSIGVFNRSHYESVLIEKVLDLPSGQKLPPRAKKDIWAKRYRQICDLERHLYENGTTIVKVHLHLSRAEQTRRFIARLDDEAKNWKFSLGDLDTAARWDDYMKAYRDAINRTAAPHAPWYVVPADKKWYARCVVSEIVLDALRKMNPKFPKPDEKQNQALEKGRALLEGGESAMHN